MFGHNPFSWVPLRAESIISFKSEGDGEEWRSIPNSSSDDDSHEDNGWTADPCEASFFLSKGSGDTIGIIYPLDTAYNTGEWWNAVNGEGGATSMTVSGYWAGEPYVDAYIRVLMIVGNHWDGDADQGFDAQWPGEIDIDAIPTITTIARPLFGNAKWAWINNVTDFPVICAEPAEVSCVYGNWGDWGICNTDPNASTTPGSADGSRSRTKLLTSGPQSCEDSVSETESCYTPQTCEWGAWSEWSGYACGVWDATTESFPTTVIRTRTRQIVRASQGYADIIGNEGCPDRDSYMQDNGIEAYAHTHTETETVSCPTYRLVGGILEGNNNCNDGEELRFNYAPRDAAVGEYGERKRGYYCDACSPNTDSNATTDEYGCKSGCIDGYALNSAGECEEQCREGFELIDGECKKTPALDDKKTTITTQTAVSTVIEPESPNMAPIIGGLALLGVVGYYFMNRQN